MTAGTRGACASAGSGALSRSARGTQRPHAMHWTAPPIAFALTHTGQVAAAAEGSSFSVRSTCSKCRGGRDQPQLIFQASRAISQTMFRSTSAFVPCRSILHSRSRSAFLPCCLCCLAAFVHPRVPAISSITEWVRHSVPAPAGKCAASQRRPRRLRESAETWPRTS